MGILDVKEFTTGVMKSCVNMEHPSGMVIRKWQVNSFAICVAFPSMSYGTGFYYGHWVLIRTKLSN